MKPKLKWKRITASLLTIVMTAALFSWLPGMSKDVSAGSLPELTNVKISSEGILSCDPFEGAKGYDFTLGSGGGFSDTNEIDLNAEAAAYNFKSGTYNVALYALSDDYAHNGEQISAKWTGTFDYVSPYTQLDTPTNLKWNGTVVSWDAVPGATSYNVILRGDAYKDLYITTNSFDMSDYLADGTHSYYFTVYAISSDYIDSETAEGPTTTLTKTRTPLSNTKIEKGVFSWDAFEGAKYYMVSFASGGGYYDTTEVNLNELAKTWELEDDTYDVSVYAMSDYSANGGIQISAKWQGTYTFKKPAVNLMIVKSPKGSSSYSTDADIITGGTLTGSSGTVTVDKETAYYGEEVTVTAIPAAGYKLKKINFLDSDHIIAEDITATGKFTMGNVSPLIVAFFEEADSFSVSFENNGHGTKPGSQTIDLGGKVTKPADLTAEGYVFEGWYKDQDFTTEYNFDSEVKNDLILYAKWSEIITAANCTVTLPEAGANPDTNPVSADPSKYDVVFDSWYLNEHPYTTLTASDCFESGRWYSVRVEFVPKDGYVFSDTAVFKINGKKALKSAKYYDVWFQASAATGYSIKVNSGSAVSEAQEGSTVIIKADTPAAGTDFDKWVVVKPSSLVLADATSDTTTFTMPAEDVEVTATYKDNGNTIYTVFFKTNGGSAVSDQRVEDGKKATKPSDPTKANYVFAGWYTDASLSNKFDFDTPITGNITLYAKYATLITSANCTVTKPLSGESPDMNPVSGDPSKYEVKCWYWYLYEGTYPTMTSTDKFESGKRYSVRMMFIPKDGYAFDYTTVFTINGETASSYGGIGNKEIVYKTLDKCVVKFDANGQGTAPSAQTIVSGSKAVKPADPSAKGFEFGGWYLDSACTKSFNFDKAITANVTLYAKWTVKTTPAPTTPATPTPAPESSGMSFEDFVERLYVVALGRASEPEGKAFWCEHVGNGDLTGAACANEFLLSKEFNDRGLSDEEFLKVLYKTFFDRDAANDPDGFKFWMNSLKTEGRDKVVDGFINSAEWCNICASYGVRSGATRAKATTASANAVAFATRLYTKCLGRDPEEEGLKFWSLGLTNQELSGTQAAKEFFYSAEFVNAKYSDEEYINRMYETFMGREPEAEGKAYWLNELKNGTTRDEVFNFFSTCPEFTGICKEYAIQR